MSNLLQKIKALLNRPKDNFKYDGGYAYLDKDKQIQAGLKIFNDALKGKK